MKKTLQKKYDGVMSEIKDNGYYILNGKIKKIKYISGIYIACSAYSHKSHGDCYYDCCSYLLESEGEYHEIALKQLGDCDFFHSMEDDKKTYLESRRSFERKMVESYGKTDIPDQKIVDKMYDIYDDIYGYYIDEVPFDADDSTCNITFLFGVSDEGIYDKYPGHSWDTFSEMTIPHVFN